MHLERPSDFPRDLRQRATRVLLEWLQLRVRGLGVMGLVRGSIGIILAIYWDNGKENGNYYRVWGLGLRVLGVGLGVHDLGFRA